MTIPDIFDGIFGDRSTAAGDAFPECATMFEHGVALVAAENRAGLDRDVRLSIIQRVCGVGPYTASAWLQWGNDHV